MQEIQGIINGIINKARVVIYDIPAEIYILALALIVVLFIILMVRQKRVIRKARKQNEIMTEMFSRIEFSKGLEESLSTLLGIIQSVIPAEGYYFYLRDEKTGQFNLKAVRHQEKEEGDIAPRYSGLLNYNKEEYLPLLTLPADQQPKFVSIVSQGQVPMLAIPVEGGRGIVHIGPLKEVERKKRRELSNICSLMRPVLDVACDLEKLRNQVDIQTASSLAVQNFTSTARDFIGNCRVLINLTTRMIGARGGCFLVRENVYYSGFDRCNEENQDELRISSEDHAAVCQVLGAESLRALTRNDQEFYYLPEFLTKPGIELVIAVMVPDKLIRGVALFWYHELPQGDIHRFTGLQLMMKRMADLLDSYQRFSELSKSYLDMLKMMVETIDNLEPFTVGYSELMARYAGIIAREMNLDQKTIEDVVLAASLSNVGVLGFSNELLFKEGKYTEQEFETMKLHAEVGAAIIEATIASPRIAEYIRYHHERIDGYGYPAGLKGEEIPIGSRIIAVVQTFLAKINGRRYRDPLPFDKAIELLKEASGTQLDENAVKALLAWFEKKQSRPECKGRSLGRCWEMRCAPLNLCQKCPAFKQTDVNCWEIEGVLCESHGNTCRTCFVYTEFLYRMGPKFDYS